MKKTLTRGSLIALVVLGASLTMAVTTASADWTFGGKNSTLSASNTTLTVIGSPLLLTCPTSDVVATPAQINKSSLSVPAASVEFGTPSPSNCTTNIAGVAVSSIIASGTPWTFTVSANLGNGSFVVTVTTSQVSIVLTQGGVNCTFTVPSGTTIGGIWTNTTHSIVINSNVKVAGSCTGGATVNANFTGTFTDKTITISP